MVMPMKLLYFIFRTAAFVIDYTIFYLLVIALAKFGVAGYIGALLFLFLYRLLTTSFLGATPGMMLFKLKLKKYDFKTCLKREIYRFASVPLYLGYIYAFFDPFRRTLHDIMSGTYIDYSGNINPKKHTKWYIRVSAYLLLGISILRWTSFFVLNDIGLLGLKKAYTSDIYYQSFNGDNLMSLSQDELYMKTLGRRYTAVIDIAGKPVLIRISNKLTHTEIYRLNAKEKKLVGEYLCTINLPLQYVSSGRFRDGRELCGVSPDNTIAFIDESGRMYGMAGINISNVVTLGCGDIDMDGKDEAVVMGRAGDVEVYKYSQDKLQRLYTGKLGEDIIPETFYIDKGIVVASIAGDERIFYRYTFKDNVFLFRDKRYAKINNITMLSKYKDMVLVSHVYRNNMVLRIGRIQRLEAYSWDGRMKRIYNFGGRTGRRYAYYVRVMEGVYDMDGDGIEEIILKAVGKDDVMGQGYIIEIYKPVKLLLLLNRILTF